MKTTTEKSAPYSPGPWEIHGDPGFAGCYVHGANRICDLVVPSGFSRTPAETEANGRLIAAAPDLLAALQSLLAQNPEHWQDSLSRAGAKAHARTIIAKAGGAS